MNVRFGLPVHPTKLLRHSPWNFRFRPIHDIYRPAHEGLFINQQEKLIRGCHLCFLCSQSGASDQAWHQRCATALMYRIVQLHNYNYNYMHLFLFCLNLINWHVSCRRTLQVPSQEIASAPGRRSTEEGVIYHHFVIQMAWIDLHTNIFLRNTKSKTPSETLKPIPSFMVKGYSQKNSAFRI